MKALLTAIFSLTLWFGQVALPVAYAAEETTQTTSGVDSRYTSSSNPSNQVEGNDTGAARYRGLTMTNIALFSSVTIGVYFLKWCATKTSAVMFNLASAAFIAMELLNWASYKEASKREMKYYNNQDHDSQVKSLESAAKQTEEAAKASANRAKFASLAGAGMLISAAWALYETYSLDAGACFGATSPKQQQLNPQSTPNIDDILFYASAPKLLPMVKDSSRSIDAYFLTKEMQSFTSNLSLSSPTLDEYERLSSKVNDLENEENSINLKEALINTLSAMSEMIIPSANAGEKGGPLMTILAAGGAGLIGAYMAHHVVDSMEFLYEGKSSGVTRAAVMGATGAIVLVAAAQINKASKQLSERANEYRKLATSMDQKFQSSGELANRATQQRITTSGQGSVESATSEVASSCFTGKGSEVTPDPNCTCRTTKSCKKSEVPKFKSQNFTGSSLLSNTANLLGQAADSLYSGNTKAATTLAANGDKLAARVNRLKKSMQKHINDKMAEKGKAPIDFDGLEKKTMLGMASNINKAFDNLSASEKASLAQVIPSLNNDAGIPETKESSQINSESQKYKDSAGLASNQTGGSAGPSSLDFKFDLDEKGEELPSLEDSMVNGDNVAGVSLDEYDTTSGSDIAPQHEDIFKLIHTRYLKSAYPRFFVQRKEEF